MIVIDHILFYSLCMILSLGAIIRAPKGCHYFDGYGFIKNPCLMVLSEFILYRLFCFSYPVQNEPIDEVLGYGILGVIMFLYMTLFKFINVKLSIMYLLCSIYYTFVSLECAFWHSNLFYNLLPYAIGSMSVLIVYVAWGCSIDITGIFNRRFAHFSFINTDGDNP